MNPIWIGLFTVTGPRDHPQLHGNSGAFLWIAAQAEDAAKLELRATNVMRLSGLTVVESQQLRQVVNEDGLSDALAALIPEARRNVESVVCGTWHLFRQQDA
jgi:hypothetical protein